MREATNKQEPSSTEGGQVKVGDKVWVLCEVEEVHPEREVLVSGLHGGEFYVSQADCRPVEPSVIKESLTTESNDPEVPDGSSDPISPAHYKHLPAEAIDIIEAAIAKAPSNKAAYLHGQALKYLLRCWWKNGVEDLRKGKVYFDRLVGGFDGSPVEASGANDGPVGKRYREPTLADLANGPIECEYRDSDEEHWRSGFLVRILNGAISFLCVNQERELSGQWDQCRIEVGE